MREGAGPGKQYRSGPGQSGMVTVDLNCGPEERKDDPVAGQGQKWQALSATHLFSQSVDVRTAFPYDRTRVLLNTVSRVRTSGHSPCRRSRSGCPALSRGPL